MNAAPKLEDIMTAIGPAVGRMVAADPQTRLVVTVCEVEARRVAWRCREIAAALEPGANRDNLLETADCAENIAEAMSHGSYPDWLDRIKALCN